MPPYICTPPFVWMSHTYGCPNAPHIQTPPICLQCSFVHLYVLGGICMWYGNVGGPSYVWTPLCVWMPPHVSNTSTHLYAPLYVCMFLGISACAMGIHPICWGSGASAHLSGFWCLSVYPLDVYYASPCTFLVVHCILSLYYNSYDYYSHSDCGVFLYVISIIGDHGSLWWSFLQHWVSKMWFCHHSWHQDALEVFLPLCHSSNLHLLMPLQAYGNYAMGSPQVGFFFRVVC